MLRIGLLGCGNIGHIIARHAGRFTIVAVFDQVPDRAREIEAISGATAYREFDSFIQAGFDIVVEAASVSAVKRHAPDVLAHGKDMVIMSVGALTDPGFRNLIRAKARENGRKVYIPSGAIFGLDNLKIGRISTLRKLLLRTTKSPAALGIEAHERRQIFAGKANECIKSFPKNVNVSVAMSLAAGMDADVELFVDPAVDQNVHELFIEGDFGETYVRVTNMPSPDNPATSYLAALSVLSLLEKMDDPIVVGT
ncbi:aspartate dehydrogenase [Methanoregula formicica]|uniref:L-aspartate dehydrogenase n=1 Tax=Methanoregula formicica (strain DSM 22288 / NBRC 105244 / SMSP) TaxID=593750 RepID=L0HI40_METFS|nr:aspartate dehydrogenase [Methanoregula formicica]AGB03675.1 aspartate dehydrogenase [Methanoregula formicica SMSP]